MPEKIWVLVVVLTIVARWFLCEWRLVQVAWSLEADLRQARETIKRVNSTIDGAVVTTSQARWGRLMGLYEAAIEAEVCSVIALQLIGRKIRS